MLIGQLSIQVEFFLLLQIDEIDFEAAVRIDFGVLEFSLREPRWFFVIDK